MLSDELKLLITDLNETKNIQKCINNHFGLLYQLMQKGYARMVIYDAINKELIFNLNEITFITSMDRAKKKFKNNNSITTSDNLKKEIHNIETPLAKSDWSNLYYINNKNLIKDLESFGLTPDQVSKWGLSTERAIRNRLTDLKAKKNKEIYK